MNSAKSEPRAASSTPRPTLATGVADTPVPGSSPVGPCSSHGLDASLCLESHQTAITARPEKNRIVAPTAARPLGGPRRAVRLVLGDEVLRRAGDAVIVGPAVDHGRLLPPVAVPRRRVR